LFDFNIDSSAQFKFSTTMHFLSTLATAVACISSVSALGSTLQQVTAFKDGPTAAKMYVYVPKTKADKAPIVLAIHYCTGTANGYFTGSKYAQLADTKGFIVIFPNSPSSGGCWDVASTQSLSHLKGGDSQTIINMVHYAVANYGGDIDRVYATGSSSGAMMTNVLAGAYPDIIKAGSVYSGVPDGCFFVSGSQPGAATPGWNNACANGQSTKTAAAWGDLTRSYYPGFNGSYPKMMMYVKLSHPLSHTMFPKSGFNIRQLARNRRLHTRLPQHARDHEAMV
jgi:acetylxylan esterase